jgi:protein-L-isoaspartate(D-aspartate) O-methyltransferase
MAAHPHEQVRARNPSVSEPRQEKARASLVAALAARDQRLGERVLAAIRQVPREHFVGGDWVESAYFDCPLPIAAGQTISQPYIVALMTELLEPAPGKRILEIGTGSGYQTAVLAATGAEVFSVEILPSLARAAEARLRQLGIPAQTRIGDGHLGWPEAAPFDGIVVTAAPRQVPEALVDQLAVGGHLVVPVGAPDDQVLLHLERTPRGISSQQVVGVRFVPMIGGSSAPPD